MSLVRSAQHMIPPVLKFLAHLALVTCGVVIISFLLEFSVGLVIGSQARFLDYFVVGPTFAVPIISGLLASHRSDDGYRRWRPVSFGCRRLSC
jgi:hypothetical protein